MSLRYPSHRSIGSTGTSSSPNTVHDSPTPPAAPPAPRAAPPAEPAFASSTSSTYWMKLEITTSTTQSGAPPAPVVDVQDTPQTPSDNSQHGQGAQRGVAFHAGIGAELVVVPADRAFRGRDRLLHRPAATDHQHQVRQGRRDRATGRDVAVHEPGPGGQISGVRVADRAVA